MIEECCKTTYGAQALRINQFAYPPHCPQRELEGMLFNWLRSKSEEEHVNLQKTLSPDKTILWKGIHAPIAPSNTK